MSPYPASATLLAGISGAWAWDTFVVRVAGDIETPAQLTRPLPAPPSQANASLPAWYRRLRLQLSVLASGSLAVTAIHAAALAA